MVKAIQEYGVPPYLKVVLELALQFQFVSRSWAASLWTQQNRTPWYPEQLLQSENPCTFLRREGKRGVGGTLVS